MRAQVASVIWNRNFGSDQMDLCSKITLSADNGFFMVGSIPPVPDKHDISGHHGAAHDGWIMKTDKDGILLWQRCLGGTASDLMHDVQATPDGGCIVVGYGKSTDGDLSGLTPHSLEDIYVFKLSSAGAIQWVKSFGGSLPEEGRCVTGAPDGGYLVAATGKSNDGDISGNHGGGDILLLKLDVGGNLLWQKSLGGSNEDVPARLRKTADGGYLISGFSKSKDGDVGANRGDTDWWLMKIDGSGAIVWQNSFGGSASDRALDMIETPDGGYIAVGMTYSADGDITSSHGSQEAWVIKLSAAGKMEWQRTYGGTLTEEFNTVENDGSGGYFISGTARSEDGDVNPPPHGNPDYWFVHLDNTGNFITRTCLGGVDPDMSVGFALTPDGGIVMGGGAGWASGDVSKNYGAGQDFWLVKFQKPVGIPERSGQKPDIRVYTIPGEATYVQLPESCKNVQLTVLNMQGQVAGATISGTPLSKRVSVNELPDAVYLLQMLIDGEKYCYTISK
ncbi:MAG: hypothetical protein JNL13_08485 [Chitinophagaceae bacterium]|nr:hypothetical protein [Chitinophagaceae bacterium]